MEFLNKNVENSTILKKSIDFTNLTDSNLKIWQYNNKVEQNNEFNINKNDILSNNVKNKTKKV